MNRRFFLKSSGAFLSLPFVTNGSTKTSNAKRLFIFVNHLGFLKRYFNTKGTFDANQLPPLLKPFQNLSNQLTIVEGLKESGDGHRMAHSSLNGTPITGPFFMPSFDQYMGNCLKKDSLYSTLSFAACKSQNPNVHWNQFSWKEKGKPVHQETNSYFLYNKFFTKKTPETFGSRKEVLDILAKDIRTYQTKLSVEEKDRFNLYLHNIEQSSQDIKKQLSMNVPRELSPEQPVENLNFRANCIENLKTQVDIAYHCMLNNFTNICTVSLPSHGYQIKIDGKSTLQGYHSLSHHANVDEKLEELKKIDLAQMEIIARFAQKLKNTPEGEVNMLDNTVLLVIGGMSDANKHSPDQRPVCLIGGGLKHKGLAFAGQRKNSDLFVTLANHLGKKTSSFGLSKSNFNDELL